MSISAKCTCGYSVSGICTGSTTPQCINVLKPMDKTTQDKFNSTFTKERYSNGQRIDIEKFVSEIIAGATAVHERAQKLANALEKAIQHFDSIKSELAKVWPELANTPKVDWVIEGEAALQQWKDGKKEVERPEHNVSIGEWITYCKACGFPVDECNCVDK